MAGEEVAAKEGTGEAVETADGTCEVEAMQAMDGLEEAAAGL